MMMVIADHPQKDTCEGITLPQEPVENILLHSLLPECKSYVGLFAAKLRFNFVISSLQTN